ncbi:uncharacterized protein LOC129601558 isoform X1 [Paramacrobiotus metropolitanus]|uniref:uncharacterized protein LOC129601558 isoform X1 n=1 Tax=Paramacrobiotus metropolitanus TaxID=2943436 RepID=UPI0024458538|nr:uncharacterized protein LOC129601558 isoform X1 [Paramacrobiotus metropolitanus]
MLRTFAVILFVSCGHHHGVFANPVNNTCIEPNPPNRNFKFYINEREPCSGRGTCVDGQCTSCRTWEGTRGMFSKKRIVIKTSGKYCECDNVTDTGTVIVVGVFVIPATPLATAQKRKPQWKDSYSCFQTTTQTRIKQVPRVDLKVVTHISMERLH